MLFIHIGTHKTGTSALQRFFFNNQESLSRFNVRYPQSGIPNGQFAHHDLAHSTRSKRNDDIWSQLNQEIEPHSGFTHVVSSESFWKADPVRVRERCEMLGPTKIIAYLRRQDNFFESLYKHHIKLGGRISFEAFLAKRKKLGNYMSVLERWDSSFGSENMIVRLYETATGTIDIIDDFLRLLNISEDAEFTRPARVNSSPRAEVVSLLRAANQIDAFNSNGAFARLRRRNPAYARSGDLLNSYQRSAIVSNFEECNREIARRYPESSFPTPGNGVRPVWPIESDEYVTLLIDLFEVLTRPAARQDKSHPEAERS